MADFVTPQGRLADVGTDHAYVPICLMEEKKISGGSGRTCIVVSKNRTQELERELAAAVKEGTGVLWVLPVLPKGRQEEEETPRGVTVLRWEVG